MLRKLVLAGATVLVAATLAANAQSQFPSYAAGPAPQAPQSWSFDPYTSGLGPCPQRRPGDPPCYVTVKPTYGQPSYWPAY